MRLSIRYRSAREAIREGGQSMCSTDFEHSCREGSIMDESGTPLSCLTKAKRLVLSFFSNVETSAALARMLSSVSEAAFDHHGIDLYDDDNLGETEEALTVIREGLLALYNDMSLRRNLTNALDGARHKMLGELGDMIQKSALSFRMTPVFLGAELQRVSGMLWEITAEQLEEALHTAISDEDWLALAEPFGDNAAPIRRLIESLGAEGETVAKALENLLAYALSCSQEEFEALGHVIERFDETLLTRVKRYPEIVTALDSRVFEQVVGEIFHRLGYSVELTPRSADRGLDLVVVTRATKIIAPEKFVVECKRYRRSRKVGVAVARQLLFVLDETRANKAFLVTTSTFTRGVHELQRAHEWQLELVDYEKLMEWIATLK